MSVNEQIRSILDPILGSMGLSLWDMEFQKQGPKWLLRIYIDRDAGGVTLSDCEAVSRDLGTSLDVEDIIPHAYTLEVSSPGLDRTLTKHEHYQKVAGKNIKIKTYQEINGQKVFRGKLIGLREGNVVIDAGAGGILSFPLDAVAKASLEVEW